MSSNEIERALNGDADTAVSLLLQIPEDQWFDRKSGRVQPKDLAKPLIAMANAEGGVIAVGLCAGQVDGVQSEKANEIRQAPFDFTRPPVKTRVRELNTKEGLVLILEVEPGDLVHENTSGDCFLRVGDESRKLSFAERRELEYDRGTTPFDGTPAPSTQLSELSDTLVAEYQRVLDASTPEGALRARNLLTKDSQPTVAAYLLFAPHPQTDYPNAYVRVLKYIGNERGAGNTQMLEAGSDIRIEGSLPEQINQASREIERLVPVRRALGNDGMFVDIPIIPKEAWLEALVNAVTHRSYSISGNHIRVEIFTNRIEVTNPGRFPGIVDLNDPLSIHRHARNPRIARVLSDLNVTQELGEGIRRIFAEMRRVGLTDPLYEQNQNFVHLTLMASDALPTQLTENLPNTARRIIDVLRLAGRPLGTGQIADATGFARPTVLRHLQRLQKLKVVAWEGNSVNDPRASWRLQ